MNRWVAAASAVAISATAVIAVGPAQAGERPDPRVVAGNPAGIVHAHGGAGRGKPSGGGSSPLLTYHGGAVSTAPTTVTPIFWGTSWTDTNEKVTWMNAFYGGVGGSAYLNTTSEYSDQNGSVSTSVTLSPQVIDTSTAPKRAPSTSTVLAEVARAVSAPVANGYYPVYVDTPRGHAGYCAWHSAGTINGTPVTFAFFFNLDGDPGCDPGSKVTSYSQGVAALANVSGHELSEMVTDPQLNAWYDSQGYENADKCAWKFNGTVTIGNFDWLIQGNWSNAAYASKTGYDSLHGCITTS